MHVGVLTGGGDCPGINAVIRAVTLALLQSGAVSRVTGIERGFLGLLEDGYRPLDVATVRDILDEGGSVLGTHNRADPFAYFAAGGADCSGRALDTVGRLGLDALVAIGGDGTMTIAERFSRLGLPVVGVPKTIDNDIAGNERSFGFDSAVAVVADSLNRLETTARSHGRVMLLETMGREAGWIALEGGLAGGADAILIPERAYHLDDLAAFCQRRVAEQGYALVCLSEGIRDQHSALDVNRYLGTAPSGARLGGVGQVLMQDLQGRFGAALEVRYTLLGHLQRGGAPTAYDRVLSTRFGVEAARMVLRREFGRMVALQADVCTSLALVDVAGRSRSVPLQHELVLAAQDLGLYIG
ncbi:6-phosphofructokinase [Pelomonas sp. CA6]|uniref:6-phosphofructokinase n=1 Tax=Pelomonas sp. CA6 TaxID=2907999 RepID=UPI001F4C432A|nr:6-phosphofructokinase [Pelomonas sp. CA6]MCH7345047.1 6-phosphofructokinase [Pelomonas sp. CA6]